MSSAIQSALSGLSSSCQTALPSLLTSSFASCADVLGLVSIATASGSIITPLTQYIDDLCTTQPCSASDLANASATINNGCASDIQSGSLIPTALNLVVENFGGVRSLLCTKQTSNNTYCVPEILSAAQNATNTDLSVSQITSLISGGDPASFLSKIPSSVYCTDCGHAITSEALKIAANVSSSATDTIKNAVEQQCGSGFGDGQLPSSISTAGESGVASASKNTGAAAPSAHFSSKAIAGFVTVTAVVAGLGLTLA